MSKIKAKNNLKYEMRKAGSVEQYFDKLMQRRRESPNGVIDLPRANFEDVLSDHVHTEEDYKATLVAFYNYLGHRNHFP